MNSKVSIVELMHWRAAEAELAAPPAPAAREMLAQLRPWWEVFPERFAAAAQRLKTCDYALGYAMVDRHAAGFDTTRVACLWMVDGKETEVAVRVVHFEVSDDLLQMRFEREKAPNPSGSRCEVTFVDQDSLQPLFTADAWLSAAGDHSVTSVIPHGVAMAWERLQVTDPMPFRLIISTRANWS